jgi:hypothetical protein
MDHQSLQKLWQAQQLLNGLRGVVLHMEVEGAELCPYLCPCPCPYLY